MVVHAGLFASLPSASSVIWQHGMFVSSLAVSQCHLLAQLGGASIMPVHACHVPMPPPGNGAHLFIHLLCSSTRIWWLVHLSYPRVTK